MRSSGYCATASAPSSEEHEVRAEGQVEHVHGRRKLCQHHGVIEANAQGDIADALVFAEVAQLSADADERRSGLTQRAILRDSDRARREARRKLAVLAQRLRRIAVKEEVCTLSAKSWRNACGATATAARKESSSLTRFACSMWPVQNAISDTSSGIHSVSVPAVNGTGGS